MDAKTLEVGDAELYINRELSLLEFNRRVLAQALDDTNPLLERLKFLCIASSNLDEFFEIRVAGLKQQVAFNSGQTGADQMPPAEQLRAISETAHALVEQQYQILNEEVLPLLAQENIHFLKRSEWNAKQAAWVRRFFNRELLPVLSPIGLDPSHPFPRILNKSLNFLVSLEGTDAFGRNSVIAILQAPRSLPRIINIPEGAAGGPNEFVFLSSIIHAHVDDIFPGMEVTGCYQFRVTRNSDLFVDDEEVEDLLQALDRELHQRRFGDAVRLEIASECPLEMASLLMHEFKLLEQDVYRVDGPVNLTRLMAVHGMVERPDLKFPPFNPGRPLRLTRNSDTFEVIRRGDVLLHHPFQSFNPIADLLFQAARDPDVLVIKQTLYRTGPDSTIVEALVEAAEQGKEVTVVIELKARFDEQANIDLANRLQEAGAHVVYGIVGHKTHAKMILIVRREGRLLRRYVHLGTGNYHPQTARLYTDYGLLTCDNAIGVDVQKIFHQLTAPGRAGKLKKLLQSPFTMHKTVVELIEREAGHARAGRAARIIAKMNALSEVKVINALYEASRAGVKIDLIIRGVCALRPGIEGISDNIRVRSIVGRFLEHTRVYQFANDGNPELYLSSADWMGRNFFNRVETAFCIEDKRLHQRIVKECLNNYLADNVRAWVLKADGSYARVKPGSARPRDAQARLLEQLAG
ncbi:MAG: polyphosphate kinase 1 [Gammaproteobacteria bacterium]